MSAATKHAFLVAQRFAAGDCDPALDPDGDIAVLSRAFLTQQMELKRARNDLEVIKNAIAEAERYDASRPGLANK